MRATSGSFPGGAAVVKSRPGTRIEPDTMKTFELLSIIGSIVAVGVALAAVVIGSNANLRAEVHGLLMEMRADIRAIEVRLSALEQRQARTEGLLEGLRDAINTHSHQQPSPGNDAG